MREKGERKKERREFEEEGKERETSPKTPIATKMLSCFNFKWSMEQESRD